MATRVSLLPTAKTRQGFRGSAPLAPLSARLNEDNPQQQSGITSPTDLPLGRAVLHHLHSKLTESYKGKNKLT